jgi:ZIP family zinc transporter
VALVSAAAAAAGYGLLGGASPAVVAVVQAFAAGAIRTVLAGTAVPEGSGTPGTPPAWSRPAGFPAAFLLGHR